VEGLLYLLLPSCCCGSWEGLSPDLDLTAQQVIENPHDYDIPAWMLNRRKDWETGKDLHNVINKCATSPRARCVNLM